MSTITFFIPAKWSRALLATGLILCTLTMQGQEDKKMPIGISKAELANSDEVYIAVDTSYQVKGGRLVYTAGSSSVYILKANERAIDSFLQVPQVRLIQAVRTAKEEMVINGSDLGVNHITLAHRLYKEVNGEGVTVSIKENRPDTTDIDFRNRFKRTGAESPTLSSHATAMATLTSGAGNTYYTGKGVAYKSILASASFANLLPEPDIYYQQHGIKVQNHSYGTGIENFYGADAMSYDQSVVSNPALLHVFSAGNAGNQSSSSGIYGGINGFANITGSFKQSKNSISIGSTDSFYTVEALSSRGPAYDGRIKPELVAYGQDGSSGAAALVSGTALLLQDAYQQKNGGQPAPASLVKAILVNTADDIGVEGPDYKSGFGSMNTTRAVGAMMQSRYLIGTVTNGSSQSYTIQVPINARGLKITLAWTDPPAAPNAANALVNDLDIEVVEVSTGITYLPWVLSSAAHVDSLNKAARRTTDTLNNVEQVSIALPAGGSYIIRVKGSKVQGSQNFAVAYNWQTAGEFMFSYPTADDNLLPGRVNTARWLANLDTPVAATMEISYDNGNSWEVVATNVDVGMKYQKLYIKDTVALAQLKLSQGSQSYLSEQFTVTPRIETKIGYNCVDSFLLYWNKLSGVSHYTIYGLTDSSLRPLYQVADTSLVIYPGSTRHYAVAPQVSNKEGLRSYAMDYRMQGVGCYIKSFLADMFDDTTVHLSIVLGTRHEVKEVSFERLYPLTQLASFMATKDTFSTTDILLRGGIYYYRAKLLLANGSFVYSDTIQVVIHQDREFFVYPNPVTGGKIIIRSRNAGGNVFELFNMMGQKVLSRNLSTDNELVLLPVLQPGLYVYRILHLGRRFGGGKLIISK